MRFGKVPIPNYTIYTFSVLVLILLNTLVYSAIYIEETRPPLTVTFFDVGQGDATLIEAENGNRMLIDVGGGAKTASVIAESLPFYDQSIDVVAISHPHADHLDGLTPMLEYVDVGVVLDSGSGYRTSVVEDYNSAIDNHGVDRVYARRGMHIRLSEDVFATVLFPDRNTHEMDPDSASMWLKLNHKDISFLFTGDAFSTIESYMADLDGKYLESEVFHAGHHGSRTSNSLDLLMTVMPEYTVVSASEDNSYGHPHEEVLERFDYVGAETLKTFLEGDIVFVSTSDGLEVIK